MTYHQILNQAFYFPSIFSFLNLFLFIYMLLQLMTYFEKCLVQKNGNRRKSYGNNKSKWPLCSFGKEIQTQDFNVLKY